MTINKILATAVAAALFAAAPAGALPSQATNDQRTAHAPRTPTDGDHPGRGHPTGEHNPGTERSAHGDATDTPAPNARAQRKAHGTYCAEQSKRHVKGQKGTPFSQCVTAMAKLANGRTDAPRTACEDLSKKRVEGQRGTPFSLCVVAGAKLKREQRADDDAPDAETPAAPTA